MEFDIIEISFIVTPVRQCFPSKNARTGDVSSILVVARGTLVTSSASSSSPSAAAALAIVGKKSSLITSARSVPSFQNKETLLIGNGIVPRT